MFDGIRLAEKTHCDQGHEFTSENTRFAGATKVKRCRTCERSAMRKYQAKRRIEEPEKVSALRQDSHARMRYGFTCLADRDTLLSEQDNACAICGTTDCTWGQGFNERWHVDHKHDGTANHRGILCGRCNLMLGRLEQVGIDKVTAYLEANR